jgi:hypothetical protein
VVVADSYADMLERLFVEFESGLSLIVIEQVARQCRDDLRGQTPDGSGLELLERLIRQRLALRARRRVGRALTAARRCLHVAELRACGASKRGLSAQYCDRA